MKDEASGLRLMKILLELMLRYQRIDMKIVIFDKMNEKFLDYAIGKQLINCIIINFDRKV